MTMQHLPRPWMLAALTDVPVALLARQGLLVRDGDRLALTPAGIPVLDAVLREIAV